MLLFYFYNQYHTKINSGAYCLIIALTFRSEILEVALEKNTRHSVVVTSDNKLNFKVFFFFPLIALAHCQYRY